MTTETVTDHINEVELVSDTENYVEYELRPETRLMELEVTRVVGGSKGLFGTGIGGSRGREVTVTEVQEYTVNVAHAVDKTRQIQRPQARLRDV